MDRVVEVVPGGLVEHARGWRPASRTAGLRLPPPVVGLLLVRALARTGALSSFAAGRTRV